MFAGMIVFLVSREVQNRRLEIWRQKLVQMGASIESRVTKSLTHILAMNSKALLEEVGSERLGLFKGSVVLYQWLQVFAQGTPIIFKFTFIIQAQPKITDPTSLALYAILNDLIARVYL
ncbi:hypothetical protein OROMI_025294 [Orobanche minor]